ncbi:MAG: NUDIX hydrolase [Actinomycetota bacterium]|nr:NUDIX hydrolase [Actinomycetota bacterium]
MRNRAALLARGPWAPGDVDVRWHQAEYEPPAKLSAAADARVAELAERGSPAHDGMAARMRDHEARDGGLWLELQPARWALRLVDSEACDSLTALCVVRREDGRWLAGRRASWLATWAEQWALGAGGAVEVGESPVQTLTRELDEEWQLRPSEVAVEALVRLPSGLAMLVGQVTVPSDALPVPDAEHDEFAWWAPDPADWPPEADERLRRMGVLLG